MPPQRESSRTFSFARGNLSKILDLPRYAIGAVRSRFTRRDPRLWVIASNFGLTDGAWAFDRAARRASPAPRIVWLVSSAEQAAEAEAKGVEWCPRDTEAGLALTLRAGLVAVTHGFGDANRYGLAGAVIVQLWHGSPLKKLHADSPATLALGSLTRVPGAAALIAAMYRRGNSRISLLPVASPEFVRCMGSAFTLTDDQVRPLGEPRTDVLFAGTPVERRTRARSLLADHVPDLGDRRVILHAPTWRDGASDPTVPTSDEWALIDEYLDQTDSVLLIRPHPLGIGAYTHSSPRVRLVSGQQQRESMPMLWGVDVLVTDYSSMIFDFAVTGGPLVALAPDLEHYRASRGLYFDYAEITGGWTESWAGVLDRLRQLDADRDLRAAACQHSLALAARFHAHTDGHNADRVVARSVELVTAR